MAEITPRRDEIHQQLIAKSFGWCSRYERLRLLNRGTPEERAAFVQKHQRRMFIAVGAVAAYFVYLSLIPKEPGPPPPMPEVTVAGQVQSLRLHETAFSRSTTVVTTTGTYQVHGGVSAANGDEATLKRDSSPINPSTSFCIESSIKKQCYELL